MLFKPRRIKLAQNQNDFDAQARSFLESSGIEVTEFTLSLFAASVQHGPQDEDDFEPKATAKRIRKAIASQLAYYLIHPEKRPAVKTAEPIAAGDHADETKD